MESEGIDLTYSDMLRIIRGSWRLILLLTLGFGMLAGIAAFLMPPVYRAEVLLASASTEAGRGSSLSRLAGQLAPLAGLIGGLDTVGGLDAKEVRLATLRSRHFTEDFIRDKNLLPALFPQRWDASAQSWKLKDGKPWIPAMGKAVKLFDEKIRKVSEDRRTGLITLAVEWREPEIAAQWANELVARANQSLRERAIGESKRSISFLEEELRKTSVVERQQIIYNLIESKIGEVMMGNARKDYAFLIIDPAVAPEPSNFVRPKRIRAVFVGVFLGLFLGILYASIRWARKTRDSHLHSSESRSASRVVS